MVEKRVVERSVFSCPMCTPVGLVLVVSGFLLMVFFDKLLGFAVFASSYLVPGLLAKRCDSCEAVPGEKIARGGKN